MSSIYQKFYESVQAYPDYLAIHYEGTDITYKTVNNEVDKIASALCDLKVKPGDVIAVVMPNTPEAVYTFYAINKVGAISYEIHPQTPPAALKRFLKFVNAKLLITLDIFLDNYYPVAQELTIPVISCNPFEGASFIKRCICQYRSRHYSRNTVKYRSLKATSQAIKAYSFLPGATAVLLNSGGTTSDPKVIELSNEAINNLAGCGKSILGITDPKGVFMFAVLPMFHGFGLCMGIHAPIINGACTTLMTQFHTLPTIKLIKKRRLTILIGVPTLYKALLKRSKFYGKHLSRLTATYVGGDTTPPDLINEFNAAMEKYGSTARMYEGYGLTETVTVCTVNTITGNRLGSVGKPVSGAMIKIVDRDTREELSNNMLGEIMVGGNFIMNGYYHSADLTKNVLISDDNNQKWVLTGDYGYLDDDGYLYFKQRLKRLVKVSGYIVCPSDLEKLVSNMEEVYEAYATGTPDNFRGEVIKLFVVLNKNLPDILEEEIRKKINETIAREIGEYATAKTIIFLDKMPKTAIGKIDGKVLEES